MENLLWTLYYKLMFFWGFICNVEYICKKIHRISCFFFRYNSIAVNIGQNATKQAVCRNLFQIIRKIAYSVSNELFPHQTQHINMTKWQWTMCINIMIMISFVLDSLSTHKHFYRGCTADHSTTKLNRLVQRTTSL